ncbi:hypothetical protein [Rubrivivax albus]|uniref:EF-hand domain-containing protein n=1 Tax=Rubrivivax albus TaxID=2499835 RepID=A0A437JYU6_9BURK|nr:hypothetical protein [Rubrivivax albus]RVT52777.1 hypothetical protein ENE75_10220 [Rubrivivax albus]
MNLSRFPTLIVAAAALTACGGGGGTAPTVDIPNGVRSGVATAGADINAGNAASFAGPLARAVLTGASGDLLDPTGGTTASPSAAAGRPAMAAATPTLVGATLMHWLGHLQAGQTVAGSRRQALAVQTEVLPCTVSGTLQVSFDDADGDQAISAGDVIAFLATACVEDPALPAINGGFTMTVNAATLASDGEPTALDVSASFQDFTLAGYGTLNGAFRLWARQETAASARLRISYLGTQVSEPTGAAVYDFDVDGLANVATGSFELGGGFGLGGQTYAIATVTRLGYAVDASPSSGELRLRDAGGDEVRLLPRSALSFDLEYWPAGAAQPALVLDDLLWDDYTD